MGLPFSLPSYIHDPESAMKAAVQIECFGIDTSGISGVLIDDSYWLEGHEASNSFFLLPKDSVSPVSYSVARFFADCIAFEHHSPALAIPVVERISEHDVPWFLTRRFLRVHDEDTLPHKYLNSILSASSSAFEVSEGGFGYPIFKYDWLHAKNIGVSNERHEIKASLEARFRNASQAIHLYNAALRQSDPLSQYLCYYRIIEHIDGNNGTNWIKRILTALPELRQEIWYLALKGDQSPEYAISKHARPFVRMERFIKVDGYINVAELIQASGLSRLQELSEKHSIEEIAKRLYKENRCGIAHGKDIRLHAIDDDFIGIINDLKLIRLLGRLAVESLLPS